MNYPVVIPPSEFSEDPHWIDTNRNWQNGHQSPSYVFLEHINKDLNLLNHVPLSAIREGDKYVVILSVYQHLIRYFQETRYKWVIWPSSLPPDKRTPYEEIPDLFRMPERVWKDSGNGLVTWIIEFTTEADFETRIRFDKMIEAFNLVNHPNNLIFLTGAAGIEDGFNHILKQEVVDAFGIQLYSWNRIHYYVPELSYTRFNTMEEFNNTKIKSILKKYTPRFKGVMYARVPRAHRVFALAYFKKHGILQNIIHSLGGLEVTGKDQITYQREFPDYLEEINYFTRMKEFINCQIREPHVDLRDNQAQTISFDHSLESYLHIVSETCQVPYTFITEKSYKPFWMMQPFVMLGPQDLIKEIRNRGFKTFDKWIDHSYDSITHSPTRIKAALDEARRLLELPDEQWQEMMIDMLPDLIYNSIHVAQMQSHIERAKLIKPLVDFFNT